ncbi:MAG: biotin--[acetyl-CoA-carboxylase] ligase [Gaiella sp.]
MTDLAPRLVAPRLGRLGTPYLWVQECTSTQDVLRAGAQLREGALAATEHQTAGRGRRRRTWDDKPGSALLFSLLLEPPAGETGRYPLLSLVAALAVAESVEQATGRRAVVKWPNDVLLEGRKVAGILLEATGNRVIAGVGINVNQSAEELPRETRVPAGSLAAITGQTFDRGSLLIDLLGRLSDGYDRWRLADASLTAELDERNALRGETVTIGGVTGIAGRVTADGALEIETPAGLVQVGSGEVDAGT